MSNVTNLLVNGQSASVKLRGVTPSSIAVTRPAPGGGVVVPPSGFTTLTGMWYGGNAANVGYRDGAGSQAKFYGINGMCVGADGFLYVAEYGPENQPFATTVPENERGDVIRKVDRSTGYTSTLAGLPGQTGLVDGGPGTAKFHGLVAMYPYTFGALDGMLVADHQNGALRFVSYSGNVSTISSACYGANGVCVDSVGNIYVCSFLSGAIWKLAAGTFDQTQLTTVSAAANLVNLTDDVLIIIPFGGAGQIVKYTISTNTQEDVAVSNSYNGIAKAGNYIYFTGPFTNKCYKMLAAPPWTITEVAGTGGTSDPATDLHGLACVAADSSYLYIGEFYGCRVLKQALT